MRTPEGKTEGVDDFVDLRQGSSSRISLPSWRQLAYTSGSPQIHITEHLHHAILFMVFPGHGSRQNRFLKFWRRARFPNTHQFPFGRLKKWSPITDSGPLVSAADFSPTGDEWMCISAKIAPGFADTDPVFGIFLFSVHVFKYLPRLPGRRRLHPLRYMVPRIKDISRSTSSLVIFPWRAETS